MTNDQSATTLAVELVNDKKPNSRSESDHDTLSSTNKKQNDPNISIIARSKLLIQQNKAKWLSYACFLIMTALVFIPTGFYQVRSNDLLGKDGKNDVKKCMLAQFAMAGIMSVTISHWRQWGTKGQRLIFCCIIWLFTMSTIMYCYPRLKVVDNKTQSETTDTHKVELVIYKICIILCIMTNQIAFQCAEITLMEHVAGFHKSCTNAVSTGAGLGAIIGSYIGALDSYIDIIPLRGNIAILYMTPILLPIFFFHITPNGDATDQSMLQIELAGTNEQDQNSSAIGKKETNTDANSQNDDKTCTNVNTEPACEGEKEKQDELNDDANTCHQNVLADGSHANLGNMGEFTNIQSNAVSTATIEIPQDVHGDDEPPQVSVYEKKLNVLQALKIMFVQFTKYTLPLFGSYFLWEFGRNAIITHSYGTDSLKKVFREFAVYHRWGSFIGKSSTNLWHTKRLYLFPLLIAVPLVWMTIVLFGRHYVGFLMDFVEDGKWILFLGIGIPIGFLYGSTSANVFYAIRENVKPETKRAFLLSNIKQGQSFGQLSAALLAFAWEYILKAINID